MEEAKGYLKTMREELLAVDDPRFAEWVQGARLLLWFAFGELSVHTRLLQHVLTADTTLYVFYSHLSGCWYRAHKKLLQNGLPNPLLPVPEGLLLPAFSINRRHQREQLVEVV